jgi:hypothetical protein
VTHVVVKRAYVELAERASYLKRLAFYTLTQEDAEQGTHFKLSGSKPQEIDCAFEVDAIDVENARRALDCYETFQETIENTRIKEFIHPQVMFEVYRESHDPPLDDLFTGIA